MSRTTVCIVAIRVAALWLILGGLAAGVSIPFVWSQTQFGDPTSTVLLFSVLPVATGLLLWSFGPPVAARTFRDRDASGVPSTSDLYRVVSVFTGLSLLGKTVPQVASLLALWVASWHAGHSVLDLIEPVRFTARSVTLSTWDVQTRVLLVGTAVQLSLGLALFLKPSLVERVQKSSNRFRNSVETAGPEEGAGSQRAAEQGDEADER